MVRIGGETLTPPKDMLLEDIEVHEEMPIPEGTLNTGAEMST